MRLFLSIILLISSLTAYPQLKLRGKLRLRDDVRIEKDTAPRCDSIAIIEKQNSSIKTLYSEGKPYKWIISDGADSLFLDFNPCKMPVYFNPSSPKYFHSTSGCPRLGDYRSLKQYPVEEFVKNNSTAYICPECAAKLHHLFLTVQFLSEK